jgi:CheY-like chemotaxis protein
MRVFILEDTEERIKKFKQNLIGHEIIVTKDTKEAITILDANEPFDYICLDHDMGVTFEQPGEGTGFEVAEWIAKHPEKKPRKLLIHSMNNVGAAAMMRVLGDVGMRATYIPFLWDKIRAN